MEVSSSHHGIQWSETDETVAVVITTFNDNEFLADAIRSILKQQRPADEILVVDDGSEQDPEVITSTFPEVTLVRKPNGGLSSARNFGLQRTQSRYIAFLDADDKFAPHAIASGHACFALHPEAAMVYGGHRRIGPEGAPIGIDHYRAAGEDIYADLLVTNFIGMHATVLYRRDILLAVGGFDEELYRCEDYDVYLRLARQFPIASHPEIIAEYRRHERNMSNNNAAMLQGTLAVHNRHARQTQMHRRRAWHAGQRAWRACYKTVLPARRYEGGVRGTMESFVHRVARSLIRRVKAPFQGTRLQRAYQRHLRHKWPPAFGDIRFGDLASLEPVSRDFGYDRGNPIDRYYIENFLQTRSEDVRGHVLEVAEDAYSKRFGGNKITRQDVIHLNLPDPPVTIIGDLTQVGVLPNETFDCIIITQTLQMIFNLNDAVTRLHAALKPGGVLLVTVPGITELERGEWGEAWCWSFTQRSVRELFGKAFAPDAMDVSTHGNHFAAVAYLTGAALEEVDIRKLDPVDLMYPMIVTLRAQKR